MTQKFTFTVIIDFKRIGAKSVNMWSQ